MGWGGSSLCSPAPFSCPAAAADDMVGCATQAGGPVGCEILVAADTVGYVIQDGGSAGPGSSWMNILPAGAA